MMDARGDRDRIDPVPHAGRFSVDRFECEVDLVHVKVVSNDKQNLQAFSQAIRAFPEVMECHVVLGAYDFLLRVVAADMDAYQKFFFDKLSQLPNIREVNSFVAISEIKSTTELPLRR